MTIQTTSVRLKYTKSQAQKLVARWWEAYSLGTDESLNAYLKLEPHEYAAYLQGNFSYSGE